LEHVVEQFLPPPRIEIGPPHPDCGMTKMP
jgi:hypothetical protein